MVLAVSLDRYLVICYKLKSYVQPQLYTTAVIVFSVLVNIPKFFEFEKVPIPEGTNTSSMTLNDTESSDNNINFEYQTSRIGESSFFVLFNAYQEVLVLAFCLCTIGYSNYQIYAKIGRSQQDIKW